MEFNSRLNRKVLKGQGREIVANVIHFMQREAKENKPIKDYKKVQERVVMATGVSLSTVQKITREMKSIEDGESSSFSTPMKKRKTSSPKSNLDDFDRELLRWFIISYYTVKKKVPTLRRIHRKFVEENGYTGSHETLRKIMHDMGFRWRKTKNNRKLLMEKPDIQQLRRNFLKNVTQFRKEMRPIIYMDESHRLKVGLTILMKVYMLRFQKIKD